jgi:flavodoxin
MKSIILYYSRTRKTAAASKALAEEISADITEIEDLKNRSGIRSYIMASTDALREIKTRIKPDNLDISKYSLVYIGTPVWAGKPSPAIITAIDRYDLQGKDVILFATLGGSGGSSTIKRMEEKIEARGGRIINSFLVKTSGKKLYQIREEVKTIVEDMDLKIYGI